VTWKWVQTLHVSSALLLTITSASTWVTI